MEGAFGTGKGEILDRLKKMGYSCIQESFLPLFISSQVAIFPFFFLIFKYQQFDLKRASKEWVSLQKNSLETFQTNYKSKKIAIKDNILFVKRSSLTPLILSYASEDEIKVGRTQLKQKYSCSILHCHSDLIIMLERLGQRYFFAQTKEEKQGREMLGETSSELAQQTLERYDKVKSVYSDSILPTISVKQASVHILRMFGLKFSFDIKTMNSSNPT